VKKKSTKLRCGDASSERYFASLGRTRVASDVLSCVFFSPFFVILLFFSFSGVRRGSRTVKEVIKECTFSLELLWVLAVVVVVCLCGAWCVCVCVQSTTAPLSDIFFLHF
jgi:hypothetical protein